MDLQSRFWSHVERGDADACCPWIGCRNHKGYGQLKVGARIRKATHISWELQHGCEFPVGMLACHSCDNPSCVNPAHIWLGTALDNIRDCISKGRFAHGYAADSVARRDTHCRNGHAYVDGDFRHHHSRGTKICFVCRREREKRKRAKRAATPVQTPFNHIAYANIDGTCRALFVGTWAACLDYVTANPRGPEGGSTHIRVRGL